MALSSLQLALVKGKMTLSCSTTGGRTFVLHSQLRYNGLPPIPSFRKQSLRPLPLLQRKLREHDCCLRAITQDPFNADDLDKLSVDTLDLSNPFGHVEDVMTELGLKTARRDTLLAELEPDLESKTGVPVVDEDNKVIGVLSRKDLFRAKREGNGNVNGAIVGDYMTSPPIVVRTRAHIAEAAALMLDNKVHRVPVVDGSGRLVGILSRTDIFSPKLLEKADRLHALEYHEEAASTDADDAPVLVSPTATASMAAPQTQTQGATSPDDQWQIKYLFDGDCSLCRSLVALLQRQDAGRGIIKFVNIADANYSPADNEYISYEEAMETVHAIRRDSSILFGPEAVQELYKSVGYGWVATAASLPVISLVVEGLYTLLSKLRLPIGNAMDAMYAAHRMKKTMDGVEHCMDDEEECEATEW